MYTPQLIRTSDGSHSLYVQELDEHYHSTHGAIREAQHVFIRNGLCTCKKDHIAILEVGLGTGLNAFLSFLETQNTNLSINYEAIEAYPLSLSTIRQLNYPELLKAQKHTAEFLQIHAAEARNATALSPQFSLKKHCRKIAEFSTVQKYDLIYFDAFGPRVQPEMWEQAVLEKMWTLLTDKGILVTYCAKGAVKRTLKRIGYTVEALPGPPGKREMTRAVKT